MRLLKCSVFCLVLGISGCGRPAPKITVCVSDPESHGFQCRDPKGDGFHLPFEESGNYLALPPADAERLINYVKNRCGRGSK